MKKIIAFMMALALILSLSVTAFAAGTGSITVQNTLNGVNYKLYKIFDATYKADPNPDNDGDGTKDIVAYTLSTSSPVYNYMFVDDTKTDLFVHNSETGVITKGEDATDDAIITYLTAMVRAMYDVNNAPENDACFVANQVASSETVAFNNLTYGYYLVDTENAEDDGEDKAKIAVTITTNTPNVNVIEKNKAPGDLEKYADEASVKVGDTIEWTVSFLATNYDGSEKVVEYTITDTLSSAWAEYNFDTEHTENITVKVGEQTLVAGTDYTLDMTNTDGKPGFVVTIPWANVDEETNNVTSFKYDALETVTITYTTTVLEAAATAGELRNTAEMEWTKENGDVGGDDVESETDIFNMGFTKVDGDTNAPLAGAEFKLYSDEACTQPVYVKAPEATETAGVYIFDKDATGSNTVTTPDGGKVVIQGLAAGTYYLKETKAPDGYNLLANPITVTVGETQKNADNTDKVDSEGNKIYVTSGMDMNGDSVNDYTVSHDKLDIANNQGVELPSTGGKGTMMMITIGTMVAMAFAVLMITQKKMSIYED